MSYLHRVAPNQNTTTQIEGKYNSKGQLLDANTSEVLTKGKIDKGHKHGYEERVMRECAERCHMSQKDYNKMMQNPNLYQFESSHNNRTHRFESTDKNLQLHNCFEVIRDYQGKQRNRTVAKYEKSVFTDANLAKSSQNHSIALKGRSGKPSGNNGSNQAIVTPSRGMVAMANNGNNFSGRSGSAHGMHGNSGPGVSGGRSGGHSGSNGSHGGSAGSHGGHGK